MIRSATTYRWLFLALSAVVVAVAVWPTDERTWGLAVTTARLTAAVCAIAVPLGTAVAVLLVRSDMPGRRLGLLALAWLLFVPLYVQVGAWQAGFGLEGWQTLSGLGPAWLDRFHGAVLVHAAAAVPWVVLIVGYGLRTVPRELEELALLDGAPAQVLARVTLPHVAPLVTAAILWVAVGTAGEIAVTDLFMVRTYAEELYLQTALGAGPGDVVIAALPGMALVAWLVVAALLLVFRIAPLGRETLLGRPLLFSLRQQRWPAMLAVIVVLLLLVGLPLVNLAWKAGVLVEQTPAGRLRHWSLAKCATIVVQSPRRYQREMLGSLAVGTAAATVTLAISIALSWTARGSRVGMAILVTVIALGLAMPGPVVGLGIIKALNHADWSWALFLYDRTIVPVVMAQVVRALPVASLILWYAVATIPGDQIEMAALEGAGRLATLLQVVLPQRWPAVAAAWLSALALAVGDFGTSILVTPPGVELLSIRISGLLHFGVEDQVAGICLAMAIGFLAVALAVAALVAGRGSSRR